MQDSVAKKLGFATSIVSLKASRAYLMPACDAIDLSFQPKGLMLAELA